MEETVFILPGRQLFMFCMDTQANYLRDSLLPFSLLVLTTMVTNLEEMMLGFHTLLPPSGGWCSDMLRVYALGQLSPSSFSLDSF